jgi:uncharacterized membrane protein YcjF (UPF0283 family)
MSDAQWAMTVTGIVLTLAVIAYGWWVADASRGRDWRKWHRPLVALLGVAAGLAFIATAWMGI